MNFDVATDKCFSIGGPSWYPETNTGQDPDFDGFPSGWPAVDGWSLNYCAGGLNTALIYCSTDDGCPPI